jgi:molybdate transport system permease protein
MDKTARYLDRAETHINSRSKRALRARNAAAKPESKSYLGIGLVIALVVIALVFLALPVLALVWHNVQSQAWRLPIDSRIPAGIKFSLKTTGISLAIVVLFGTPLAYALARWRFPGKRIVNILVDLPIVMPPAVAGLGLLIAFGQRGMLGPLLSNLEIQLVFTQAAVIIAQTFVASPFYVRAAQAGFQGIDVEIENAARIDGANAWERFLYIIFPLARRSLLNGVVMSWARALGEFGATVFFAGNMLGRPNTMTLLIYSIFENDVNAAVGASLILIMVAIAVIAVTRFLVRENQSAN